MKKLVPLIIVITSTAFGQNPGSSTAMISCNNGKVEVLDANGKYNLVVNGVVTGAELTRDLTEIPDAGQNMFLICDTTKEMRPDGATHLQVDVKNKSGAVSFKPVGQFYQIIVPLQGCTLNLN